MPKRIAIFSTKGGVGKTLIATNLAISLAKDQAKKVCLIDFDTQGIGDMARMLDLTLHKTIADMIQSQEKHPEAFNKEKFLTRTTYGVDFFQAVARPQQSPHIHPQKIKSVFDILDPEYEYIVMDAGKNFSDIFISVLNQANLILLVVTPDILSIYQTKWALDTLQFLHFPLSMVKVVLNRAESASSITLQEIKVSLPVEVIAHIPSDGKTVGFAVNRGIPVVMDSPKSKVALTLKKLSLDLHKNEDWYIRHREIKPSLTEEEMLERTAQFWQQQGLTEMLTEIQSPAEQKDEILVLKQRIHTRLIEDMNLRSLDLSVFTDAKKTSDLKGKARKLVANLLADEAASFITSQEVRQKLVKEILDEALGLGALEDLLADPTITDIMVNNKDEIFIERYGKVELTSKKFISNQQVETIIERIIAPLGRRIDESVPMVDARLPDGSRINAIIPPLSLTGPTLTVRKFRKEIFKVEELANIGTLSPSMGEFIRMCVVARKNIIVSGGTGSGKTTVLNILSEFIPPSERIVTIEDAAELKLHQQHWIRLESRPVNIEGKGAITIRDLFRNTLRMRPDRIIIGECRGLETLDMLQAMNTGHDGSMTTIHANSTRDVLVRMDSMILMSGIELPMRAIREMIASAIELIIHTARLSDGSRKITQISEITGMKDDVHVEMRDIFNYKQTGIDEKGVVLGNFQPSGHIPSFFEELRIKGLPVDEKMFRPAV